MVDEAAVAVLPGSVAAVDDCCISFMESCPSAVVVLTAPSGMPRSAN